VCLSDWYSLVGFLDLLYRFVKPVVVMFSVLRSGVEGGLMFAEVGFSLSHSVRSRGAVLTLLVMQTRLPPVQAR